MNKKYLVLSLFLIALFATITTSKISSKVSSAPANSAGDPVSGNTCAQGGCHAGPVQTAGSNVSISIGTALPTTPLDNNFCYTPGTVYNIEFLINQFVTPNPYYGFQIVALNSSNAKAGNMRVLNTATNQINTSGTRQYMGHRSANSTKKWTFEWTAPAIATGAVTFYYTCNAASASTVPPSIPEGTIYKGSVAIQECPSGIEDISTKISSLNIFPNPVSNEFRISFDLKENNGVSAQFYSLDGKHCKELLNEKISEGNFNRYFDISNIPSGIYLVKLNVGESSVTQKIIKL